MTTFENVTYEVRAGRAEITIDRPEVLNAVDGETLIELNTALEAAHDDPAVYVIVLTGKGRGFCAGGDISGGYGHTEGGKFAYRQHLAKAQNVVRTLRTGEKPSVAAVNGPAVGAGCDFALACDLRVIDEEAYLREQYVNIGLIPGAGGGYLLPRLVGEAKAREYILTGRDITAAAADEMGLIVEVAPAGTALNAARALADEVRDKPVRAVRGARAIIGTGQSYEEYAEVAFQHQWACMNHPEQDEAVSALLDGRPPEFDRPYAEGDR
jgi:enoyl-CoA hydratase/carnithine racemase